MEYINKDGAQGLRGVLTGGVGTCEGGREAASGVFPDIGLSGANTEASMGSFTNWKTDSHS